MNKEREAYRLARVLVASVYALTQRRLQEEADLQLKLRHAALNVATPLFDSGRETHPEAHVAHLNQSLLALQELEQLLENCRCQLPPEVESTLVSLRDSFNTALDEAIAAWRTRRKSAS